MSGLERHTHVRHGYFRENEESEQHSIHIYSCLLDMCRSDMNSSRKMRSPSNILLVLLYKYTMLFDMRMFYFS